MKYDLNTPDEIVDALGGTKRASIKLKMKQAAISNWRARGRIPPEHYFLLMKKYEPDGLTLNPAAFGMTK